MKIEKTIESAKQKLTHLIKSYKQSGKIKTILIERFDTRKSKNTKTIKTNFNSIENSEVMIKAPAVQKNLPVFAHAPEIQNVVELCRSNRKVVAAGLAIAVTFTIGLSSMVNVVQAPMGSIALTGKPITLPLKGHASDQTVLAPEKMIATPQSESELAKITALLEYGSVFDSEKSCFVLRINGKAIAYFRTRDEGQTLLNNIKAGYQTANAQVLSLDFAERIDLAFENVSVYDFTGFIDIATATQLIRTGTLEKKLYTVKNGDVLGAIAETNRMSLSQLYAANPGIQSKKYLKIGDQLNLVVPVPLLNVKTVERITYAESVPYETVNEKTANLYKGETSVKVRGVNGEKKIVAEVVKVNGQETSRKILEQKVAKQPVSRVLAVGTKVAPPTIGSGKFSKPVSRSYTVSSPFGSRWGRLHTGIDLAMPTGSPVLASDGGKVVFAGSQSSYGKLIVIEHGGNLESYYAHNSKLLVKKGDKVFKGQKIALSGNSGRSTGPHLHFEIRVNGIPKNPKKYVRL